MKIYRLEVGMLATNCYIAMNEELKEGVIVDPGGDAARIMSLVDELGIKVAAIFVTHGHSDHIGALSEVRQATGAPVYVSEEDAALLCEFYDDMESVKTEIESGEFLTIKDYAIESMLLMANNDDVFLLIQKEVASAVNDKKNIRLYL